MIVSAGQPNAGTYFYHLDAQGSVIALSKLDTTVKVVEKYTYSAFGRTVIHSPGSDGVWGNGDDDNTLIASAYGNPYQYTSRRWDPETGLYDYRARMYYPVLGRFMQTDPIGYYDSLNLYTYCGNNPINWNDPYGLCKGSWLDRFQVGLDIAGMLDPFGVADGLNATIYLFRGQYADALMSLAGVVGADVAKLGRLAGGATAGAGLFFVAKYGDEAAAAKKAFSSTDPLVADLANAIENLYPGHVVGVNVNLYDEAGKLVTDADILVQNAVIQVKSGSGKGLIEQVLVSTPKGIDLPVIGYGPTLKGSVVKGIEQAGGLVTKDASLLIEVIKP